MSTIGEQRRSNYALQPMSKAAFVELVTADQPDAPSYFTYDAVLNSQERPTLDETLERISALTLDHVLALQAVGAQVLDTRDPAEFAAAHLAGSINVGLGGQYATWAGTVLSREQPIVIIADPGREHEAAMRLGRIGFDQVAGYLEDGLHSVESRPELMMSTERLSAQVAAERVAAAAPERAPVMVDVRAPGERQQKRIAGSVGIPLTHLGERLSELPADRPLLVYCAGGYRSSIAASLLQRHGFAQVSEIAGGITAWDAAHGCRSDNRARPDRLDDHRPGAQEGSAEVGPPSTWTRVGRAPSASALNRSRHAVSSLSRTRATGAAGSPRHSVQRVASRDSVQRPPLAPSMSSAIASPGSAGTSRNACGRPRTATSSTAARKRGSVEAAAPTARRICAWWCQSSVNSRPMSNQPADASSPAHDTGNSAGASSGSDSNQSAASPLARS